MEDRRTNLALGFTFLFFAVIGLADTITTFLDWMF